MAEKTSDSLDQKARDFYNKALAALERNNLDYAIEMFQQCLAIEPNFTKARQYLRAAQMKKTESVGGFKRALTAAKTSPLLTKAKMVLGKNPAEAMIIAEQILTEDPKHGQALTILAEAAEAAGHHETVVQTLEHYTKLNPRDNKALHRLARAYLTVGRNDAAQEKYSLLLQMNPNDFAAQKGLKDATAHGAMATGGWDEAGSYRDVLKDKEESATLEQESRVMRAEDVLENLIKETLAKLGKEPDSPVIQRELGKLYGQKGDYDKALQTLEKIFSSEGGADPSLEREIAEVKANRLEDAIAKKKKQRESNPANAAALENEIAALEKEHSQLLLTDAARLVERYPNDLMYRYELGVLYMKTGNIQGAIEQLQKAVGQPQRRVASLNYLGQCFQQMGLNDLAVDQYRKAIDELPSMDGQKKELLYNLGNTYETMGENDKAVTEYKKIAAVDFGYRDVREKITRKAPQKPS
jgi:tetratricopeptide (TPR) repeat protein